MKLFTIKPDFSELKDILNEYKPLIREEIVMQRKKAFNQGFVTGAIVFLCVGLIVGSVLCSAKKELPSKN